MRTQQPPPLPGQLPGPKPSGPVTPMALPPLPIGANDPTRTAAAPGPAPTVTVPKLDVSRMDGQGRLKTLIEQGLSPDRSDDLSTITSKLEMSAKAQKAIPALGQFSADDADEIYRQYYESVMGPVPTPEMEFSPELQQLMAQAYGGQIPTPRTMVAGDIDQNQLGVAAGVLIGDLLRGGNANRALAMTPGILASAQARVDTDNQRMMAEDAQRRQALQAMAKRLMDVEDANFQQQGYEARDARSAQRSAATQMMIGQRQDDTAAAREKSAFRAAIRNAVMTGDPERAAALATGYENEYGEELPAEYRTLAPTYGQRKIQADLQRMEDDRALARANLEGIQVRNQIARATMPDVIAQAGLARKLSEANLRKLAAEADQWPDWLSARTQALLINASANKLRASRAGSSGGGSDDALNIKFKQLNGYGKTYDDKAQKVLRAEEELRRANEAVESWNLGIRLPGDSEAAIKARAATAQANLERLQGEAERDMKRMNELNEEIDRATGGQ